MTKLGTLKPELMAALESIDQQSPVDFLDAETLVDTGLAAFNPGNDYWYELTATGEMQLNKYAAWDELRAELAALKAQHVEALAVEYGDGYEAGAKDGIRDLRGAIKLAIAQADISQRLPAVERVLAEFEAMYLSETK